MTINTTLAGLSQTVSSNGPDGAVDAPSTLDDAIRYHGAFIAKLRDDAIAFGLTTGSGTAVATAAELQTAREGLGIGAGSFRNRAINGGMQVQSGVSAALSSTLTYGSVDMILCAAVGGTGITGSIGSAVASGFSTGRACTINGASWTTGIAFFATRLESKNVLTLNSRTVTVSGKIFQDTGAARTFIVSLFKANAVDNFGAVTQIGSGVSTASIPNGVVASFSATFTLGLTDASNGLQIYVNDSAANTVVNKNYFLGDLQLEASAVATPFEGRLYGDDEALCKRYAQRVQWSVRDFSQGTGTLLMASQTFPAPMFTTPAVTNITPGGVINMSAPTVTPSAIGFRADATKAAATDCYILDRVDLMTARL